MFKTDPSTGSAAESATKNKTQDLNPEEYLICKACSTVITSKSLAVSINDSHRHVFVNPHGLVFEVRCFSKAMNISGLGPITSEFSWFPGYSWQAALCTVCQTHLGWSYQSKDNEIFFGFISDRLIAKSQH
ncbi:MAG: cereblon family protein [Desulfonatronovibrio sp.]